MKGMSQWRAVAAAVIEGALKEGKAAGLEGKELVRFVDARYPFGPRANHPYKIWLNERSRLVLGRTKRMSGPRPIVPGQGGLFDG